jgi:hypothetical protein
MRCATDLAAYTATDRRIAHSDIYPVSTCDVVPALDRYDAVEAYRAYDDGGLEAVPEALAAYVDFHQRQWL